MTLFRPDSLPVVVLIVPFVLIYAALYYLWGLVSVAAARLLAGVQGARGAPDRPRSRLGMAVSASLVLLVVLQSLGQLTLRDVLTLAGIIALGYLYVARSRFMVPKGAG